MCDAKILRKTQQTARKNSCILLKGVTENYARKKLNSQRKLDVVSCAKFARTTRCTRVKIKNREKSHGRFQRFYFRQKRPKNIALVHAHEIRTLFAHHATKKLSQEIILLRRENRCGQYLAFDAAGFAVARRDGAEISHARPHIKYLIYAVKNHCNEDCVESAACIALASAVNGCSRSNGCKRRRPRRKSRSADDDEANGLNPTLKI